LRRLGDRVIEAENITKAYDEPLFQKLNIKIDRNEKIAILGTNGIGKTTLLRTLVGELEPDAGKVIRGDTVIISHFPQDAGGLLNLDLPAIEWLQRCSEIPTTEAELRSFMGKMLFRGDDITKPVKVLSGGEKSRLVIARMMIDPGNVLVFDEPTNHLDLEAIESLNYALTLVENTVIFVSHDREFVSSLATRIIEITADGIIDYPGNFEDYEAERRRLKRR
jgi:ATPase subunit of ABC transporter with duplicated ATPase domains